MRINKLKLFKHKYLKNFFLSIMTIFLLFLIIDILSSYFLFFYQKLMTRNNLWIADDNIRYSQKNTPFISVMDTFYNKVILKNKKNIEKPQGFSTNYDLYNEHTKYGWIHKKGNYKVLFEKMDFQGNDKFPNFYKWEYNFLDNLTRATSSKQINNTKKIHIFWRLLGIWMGVK